MFFFCQNSSDFLLLYVVPHEAINELVRRVVQWPLGDFAGGLRVRFVRLAQKSGWRPIGASLGPEGTSLLGAAGLPRWQLKLVFGAPPDFIPSLTSGDRGVLHKMLGLALQVLMSLK